MLKIKDIIHFSILIGSAPTLQDSYRIFYRDCELVSQLPKNILTSYYCTTFYLQFHFSFIDKIRYNVSALILE